MFELHGPVSVAGERGAAPVLEAHPSGSTAKGGSGAARLSAAVVGIDDRERDSGKRTRPAGRASDHVAALSVFNDAASRSGAIVDLLARRQGFAASLAIEHPDGVTLPLDNPADAALLTPGIRARIRSGGYGTDLVQRLPSAVGPGDRILIIGAGLGVVSTLVARRKGVDRVIVAEPNPILCRYLERVHDLNEVSTIEVINALPSVGRQGAIRFDPDLDARTSVPRRCHHLGPRPVPVPLVDLDLILVEEKITVIVCETPGLPTELLARANLEKVCRIVLNAPDLTFANADIPETSRHLARHGFRLEDSDGAMFFRRSSVRQV